MSESRDSDTRITVFWLVLPKFQEMLLGEVYTVGTEQNQKIIEIIQDLSCAKFKEVDKGKQFTYEVMCTGDVHEYEKIFNSNE